MYVSMYVLYRIQYRERHEKIRENTIFGYVDYTTGLYKLINIKLNNTQYKCVLETHITHEITNYIHTLRYIETTIRTSMHSVYTYENTFPYA